MILNDLQLLRGDEILLGHVEFAVIKANIMT